MKKQKIKEWRDYRKSVNKDGGQADITVDKIRDMEEWVNTIVLDFLKTRKVELKKELEAFK